MAGFEPARAYSAQRILSPLRLPFRHIGDGRFDSNQIQCESQTNSISSNLTVGGEGQLQEQRRGGNFGRGADSKPRHVKDSRSCLCFPIWPAPFGIAPILRGILDHTLWDRTWDPRAASRQRYGRCEGATSDR
jgi:hypothetical protein